MPDENASVSPEQQQAAVQVLAEALGFACEWYVDAEGHRSGLSEEGRPEWLRLKARRLPMATSPTEIINLGEFNPGEWITTQEAAKITGYTKRNLTKMAKSGNIQSVKRGNMLFFRLGDILQYVQLMQAMGTAKHTPKSKRKAD